MDPGFWKKKEKNPRETANVFSIVTFFYTFGLFKKGWKKTLDDEDIYEIPSWLSSEKLGNRLEDAWTKNKKEKENPSLLLTLISVFGKQYLFLGFIQLAVKTTIIFIQPKALGKIVGFFSPNQTAITTSDLYIHAAVLIGLNIFSTIYNHNYQQFIIEVSIRVRTAMAALIFRKALKLGPEALSTVTMGKIVTLITKDIFAFENALTYVNDMWIGVINITIITYIIFQKVGWSVLGGIGFYLLIIPVQLCIGKIVSQKRVQSAKRTDARLQLTTETIKNIKTIKMYTWEEYFRQKLNDYRKLEIKYLTPVFFLKAVVLVVASTSTSLSFFLLIMTYVWSGHFANAETVYFVQTCYQSLRTYIQLSIPFGIAQCSDLHASVKRLTDFLMAEELVKRRNDAGVAKIFMKHVSSKIKETEVLRDVSITVKKGLLLITGNLGSGKSSIIKTLLGEYPVSGGQMIIDGSVSYASEEAWLFPSTIRQNILFGQEYDEKRYNEVLKVCALTVDINRLEKGDQTIVGDRGINFSKGQQARINLARAVYRNSDIYLLDDCLSALDGRVNVYIFKNCIQEFLKDKIVVMVTNNINHIKMVYGNNVVFVESGRTLSIEKQQETLDKRITYYIDDTDMNHFDDEKDLNEIDLNEEDDENTQLLVKKEKKMENDLYHEDKRSGHVKIGVYLRYYKYAGGLIMLFLLAVIFIGSQASSSYSEKVVSKWVNIEPVVSELIRANKTNTTEYGAASEKRESYLKLYAILIITTLSLVSARIYMNFFFALRASKNLHKKMANSVINAFMTFFDKHLVGNVVNRFSKDLSTTDEVIPLITYELFRNTLSFMGIMYLIISVNTFFIIPGIFLLVKLFVIQRFYLPTGRATKRLEASTRSPMIGYLNASLEGLTAVRAYDKQVLLISEFDRHHDHFTSASYIVACTSRFFAYYLDMMSTLFSAAVILKIVIYKDYNAGEVGLAISQALMLTGLIQFMIRQYTELENNMTGIERILEYTDIKTENRDEGMKFENWPERGDIEYKNVSLTYNTTKQKVLKNINFVINSKEKVGIVGRTGAGKSSIISTLFRLYDIEGNILIDGVDTKTVSLNLLRSKMAIIPQDPILYSGTIRSNLDPIGKYSDEELWDAIQKVHLKSLFMSLEEQITEDGANYSSGQRQLICLARALVSKNKIIVLDEATSNMDPETCSLLQTTMKQNFLDCTVLTIAHRLNTVLDCDKVMVIDDGEILEFDTPEALRADKDGRFYQMIKQSGLQD